MNPTPFAAPLLVLAGTAHGFTVSQFQIQPDQFIEPSVGAFYNYYEGAWIYYTQGNADNMLGVETRSYWNNYGPGIRSTTWLAIDRKGGGGEFSRVLDGPGPDPIVPEWTGFTTDDFGAGDRKLRFGEDVGDDLLSGLDAGPDGYIWGYDPINGFEALSSVSPVNGVSKDSIFFGQFVLTDPNATLVGAPLLVTIDGVDRFLPLDGTPDADGFRVEYESFSTPSNFNDYTGLRAFVVVPAPGALPLLAAAALGASGRRRP